MNTDILIVGAGLSGLSLARALEAEGRNYMVVEGRDRVGGRIATIALGPANFDTGPAWFWPGQPRMAALVTALALEKFDQYADGILTYEDEAGQVQRGRGYASMQGSFRLKGGMRSLTDALATGLSDGRVKLGAAVTTLSRSEAGIKAALSSGETITAKHVVLAIPPRVAAGLRFTPALPVAALKAMESVATWMAGQAKAVAIYDTPFWREAGLSGDAMSRRGPMVEVHDASPASGGPYALFGFIGVPPKHRTDTAALMSALMGQFGRLFGGAAAQPRTLHIKDWASDPFTAVAADKQPLYAHPHYGLPAAMTGLWDDHLLLSSTETASQFGGYLEGALEATEHVLDRLNNE